jgi:hypothetical protein
MKSLFLSLLCLIFLNAQAMEYELQFENDQISIAKAKIEPYEEIGSHRDAYHQVVIALKGGTITRLEADGRITDVHFPTGVAVVREADPQDELHKSINNSSEPVELIMIQLKDSPPISEHIENSKDISVNIKINCPISTEYQDFVKSIPSAGQYSSSFDEWKASFTNSMNHLIQLVESEKVFNSWWSVQTENQ